MAKFREEDHPRADDGKFSAGGSRKAKAKRAMKEAGGFKTGRKSADTREKRKKVVEEARAKFEKEQKGGGLDLSDLNLRAEPKSSGKKVERKSKLNPKQRKILKKSMGNQDIFHEEKMKKGKEKYGS